MCKKMHHFCLAYNILPVNQSFRLFKVLFVFILNFLTQLNPKLSWVIWTLVTWNFSYSKCLCPPWAKFYSNFTQLFEVIVRKKLTFHLYSFIHFSFILSYTTPNTLSWKFDEKRFNSEGYSKYISIHLETSNSK